MRIDDVTSQRVHDVAFRPVTRSVGENPPQRSAEAKAGLGDEERQVRPQMTEEELGDTVESLNETLDALDKGLRFDVHEGTERLMVRIVHRKSDEVLREIPPEEVLDMMAKIQEMVGLLIDERI